MPTLFNPGKIGTLDLKNRFVRSATADCLASEDGKITNGYLKLYERLAKGGVGLIITGNYYVNSAGRHLPKIPVLDQDSVVKELKKVVEIAHQHGAKIAAQINHAGRQTDLRTVSEAIAPSPVLDSFSRIKPREMTEDEINTTIADFGAAARRVKGAGFDGVQIHAAHGYLISQFLSGHTNRRTDQWGGSAENRRRFLLEVYKEIRSQVGTEYPVLIKINCEDCIEKGVVLEEAVETCRQLDTAGINGIEISGGIGEQGLVSLRGDIPKDIAVRGRNIILRFIMGLLLNSYIKKSAFFEGYFSTQAAEVKRNVGVPVISVGGMRNPDKMEAMLDQGDADFISLSRPFIRQPNLVNLIEKDKSDPIRCDNCNRCTLEVIMHFNPLRCYSSEAPGKQA